MNVTTSIAQRTIPHCGGREFEMQRAVNQFTTAESLTELVEAAPMAAGHLGFTRILVSLVDQGSWLARAAFVLGDPEFARNLLTFGAAHSNRLSGRVIESEMLLSGNPILVRDPQTNPRVHHKLARFSRTTGYVAAPIQAWGNPIAMVHADRHPSHIIDSDHQLLGVFAQALGLAFERNELADRLRNIHQTSSAGCRTQVDPAGLSRVHSTAEPHHPPRAEERLSPREWDVWRLVALGRTNAQIAACLFVTEGTVKAHLKGIFKKLSATNRTEAAALYHRLSDRRHAAG
jgi:DNA-binding CsgD family transcriptional regulator